MSLPLTRTLPNIFFKGEFNGRCSIQVVKILFHCPKFGLKGHKRKLLWSFRISWDWDWDWSLASKNEPFVCDRILDPGSRRGILNRSRDSGSRDPDPDVGSLSEGRKITFDFEVTSNNTIPNSDGKARRHNRQWFFSLARLLRLIQH